jgi:hypothetical protein
MNIFPTKLLKILYRSLQKYLQVKVHQYHLPLISTTPALNFGTSTAGDVDTGGKFVIGSLSTTPVATCRVSEVSRKIKKGGVIIPDDNIT